MKQTSLKQLKLWTTLIVPTLLLSLLYRFTIGSMISSSPNTINLDQQITNVAPYVMMGNHLLLFAFLFFVLKFERMSFQDIGFKWSGIEFVYGIGTGLILFLFQQFITLPILAHFDLFTYWVGFPGWPYLISVTLFAGVLEEAIFRGYGLTSFLKTKTHSIFAILITTMAFTMLHYGQGLSGMINAVAMGLVLGILFKSRRNLPAVMAAHAVCNFLFIIKMSSGIF